MTTEPATTKPAAELAELRARLAEAEEALRAIRNGDVDAVVVAGARGEQVYALTGADRIYRQLIETMSEGAVTLSADGVILWCNASLAKMLGRPLNQVLGTALRGYLPPAGQPALDAMLAQARTETCRREINLTTSDGHLLPAYLSASRSHREGAELVFCLVLTDLTEQKTHEQVVAAEHLARLILEQAAEAIVVCDAQGRIIRVSQAAQPFCDGNPLSRPFAEQFPLRAAAAVPFQFAPVLQGRTLRNVDVSLDRQGHKADLILNAGPLLDGQQVLGCVITLTDVTERKRAEAKLGRNYDMETAMNALLGLSMENETTTEILGRALALVLSLKWLAFEAKGAIFLADEASRALHLQVHKGFSKELLALCSTIPFGHCLCGRAAASRAVQFAACVDERHDIRYADMPPHGHYCVPILSGDHVLGVLNLYVTEGHTREPSEEDFLKSIANTLAGTIERKRAEAQLNEQLDELRRWHDVTLGRETRLLDLKRDVNELLAQAGKPPRYASPEPDDGRGNRPDETPGNDTLPGTGGR